MLNDVPVEIFRKGILTTINYWYYLVVTKRYKLCDTFRITRPTCGTDEGKKVKPSLLTGSGGP